MGKEEQKLRNELDVEVPYVSDDGKAGLKRVHIKFISQNIYAEYMSLIESIIEATQLGDKIGKLTKDIGYEMVSRRNVSLNEKGEVVGVKKTIKEMRDNLKGLNEELDRCNARINELSSHMNERKLHLIKAILIKNQIDDSDMRSDDWWLSCVDMEDMMSFITKSCTKDNSNIDSKKKLRVTEPSTT